MHQPLSNFNHEENFFFNLSPCMVMHIHSLNLLCDYFAISTHIESLHCTPETKKKGMLIIPQFKKWFNREEAKECRDTYQLFHSFAWHPQCKLLALKQACPTIHQVSKGQVNIFSFFLPSSFFLLCLRWILFIPSHQRKERFCCKDWKATF